METIKTFSELAEEQGINPEPLDSDKMEKDFQEYMRPIVRKSRKQAHIAEEEAKKIYFTD